jgi:hypothetical protein
MAWLRLQTGHGQASPSPELHQPAYKARLGGVFPNVGRVNAVVQPMTNFGAACTTKARGCTVVFTVNLTGIMVHQN